jgi:UDP-glucose 4-epimerase
VKVLITGGSGFIGSNLADSLLSLGYEVTVFDNFSTGRRRFLADSLQNTRLAIIDGDLLNESCVEESVAGHDAVVHLAANADVRFGWSHPRRDFEQNTLATQNVLEAMRSTGVRRILFSSTGSVYGEAQTIPTPEHAPFPLQTSLYGASKAAAEGLVSAYSEAGYVSATIFRFVSILGPRYTHGHVYDFVAQLLQHPEFLNVLGDGTQRKSYLHVSDCVNAILLRLKEEPCCEVLNLGVDDYCQVNDSIRWITRRMGLSPELLFAGGSRGWVGDNPFIYLDTQAMRSFGWRPEYTIGGAVLDTVDWLLGNQWVFDFGTPLRDEDLD